MSDLIAKLFYVGGQIATCDRKVRYPKLSHAFIAAGKCKWKLHPYRCSVCNEWHLTKGSAVTRSKL